MCGNRRGKIAKYDGIAEVWGGRILGGRGGRRADRPKMPAGNMAKSDGVAENWCGGSREGVVEPTGRKRQSKKWPSPMALR